VLYSRIQSPVGKPALPSWRRWRVHRITGVTQLPFLAISGPGHRSNGLSALPSKGRTRRAVKRRGASDDRFCCSVLGVLGSWFHRRRVRKFASAIFAFCGSSDLKNRLSLFFFWVFLGLTDFFLPFFPVVLGARIWCTCCLQQIGVENCEFNLSWRILSCGSLSVVDL
jgi:hypothetical protein